MLTQAVIGLVWINQIAAGWLVPVWAAQVGAAGARP